MNESLKNIDYSRLFLKQFKKAPLEMKIAFRKRFKLFLQDPFHSQLNNHQLTGKFSGYRSINITGDWRTLYSEYIDKKRGKVVVFEVLGTHNQLYK